ncbi:MAG: TolC family protein [bacterium]|jgi:outer membrane protein TolC|nr:TolC family protein [Chitinophagaceae bacterium]
MKQRELMFTLLLAFMVSICDLKGQDSVFSAREAVDMALQQNLGIQIAMSELDIARINNNWGNAGKWPVVTAGIGNSEALTNLNQQLSNGNEIKRNGVTNNILTANVSANWRIYNGMRIRATKERFDALEKMSELQLKQEINTLTMEVLMGYFNLVRLNMQARATRAIIDLSLEREKIAETRFNVGSAGKTDLLQASIDLNSQQVNLANLRQQIRVGKSNLNTLMRRNPEDPLVILDTAFTIPTLSVDEYKTKAMSQNLQLLIAQRERALLLQDRRIINAQRLPVLTLSSVTSFNRNKATGGFFLTNQTYGPNVGLNLAIPIFNGNITRTQLKTQDIRLKQQNLQTEELKTFIRRDLQIAYDEYRNALEVSTMEQKNVGLARENNFISTERFKKLQSNSIELRQAQLSLIEAQDRYITAAFRAKLASINLQWLSGEIVVE